MTSHGISFSNHMHSIVNLLNSFLDRIQISCFLNQSVVVALQRVTIDMSREQDLFCQLSRYNNMCCILYSLGACIMFTF